MSFDKCALIVTCTPTKTHISTRKSPRVLASSPPWIFTVLTSITTDYSAHSGVSYKNQSHGWDFLWYLPTYLCPSDKLKIWKSNIHNRLRSLNAIMLDMGPKSNKPVILKQGSNGKLIPGDGNVFATRARSSGKTHHDLIHQWRFPTDHFPVPCVACAM